VLAQKFEVCVPVVWCGIHIHHTDLHEVSLINCVSRAQEMEKKYLTSKAELDELVANMEGL
jgi:hypothetical protein